MTTIHKLNHRQQLQYLMIMYIFKNIISQGQGFSSAVCTYLASTRF